MQLFLEEIAWVLRNAFDSGEFRDKPFELAWLSIPKSSRKSKQVRNKVILQKLEFRDCDKNPSVLESVTELVQFACSRSHPKISVRKDPDNYRIKKRHVDRVDAKGLSPDFVRIVREELKSFFRRHKRFEHGQREMKKNGNIYYIEMISANGLGKTLGGRAKAVANARSPEFG